MKPLWVPFLAFGVLAAVAFIVLPDVRFRIAVMAILAGLAAKLALERSRRRAEGEALEVSNAAGKGRE